MKYMKIRNSIDHFFIKKGDSKKPFNIMKICSLLLCVFVFQTMATSSQNVALVQPSQQQGKTVRGTVIDSNEAPIIGATIIVKDNPSQGTITDINGNFILSNLSENAILQITYVGLKTEEVDTSNETTITIRMEDETELLDEVIVVGYGSQSRGRITTAVTKLDTKVLENIPYSNITTSLQGTLPGVRVQQTSGNAAVEPIIVIRGGTSINNPNGATPLYIVDGVNHQSLADINSEDIESIQVLKDAAATAIYGARGSNGVVLVTTKGGKAGQTKITYSATHTFETLGRHYEMIGGEDYIKFWRNSVMATARKIPARTALLTQALPGGTGNDLSKNTFYTTQYLSKDNAYKLDEGWKSMPDPLDPTKTIIYDEVNWQNILFRPAFIKDHNFAISTGTDKANLYISLGYHDNEGLALNTGYSRWSFTFNGSAKLKDNLRVGAQLLFTKTGKDSFGWGWNRSQSGAPTMKYKFEDGTLAYGQTTNPNPEYMISVGNGRAEYDKLSMNVTVEWDILPNLKFRPNVAYYQTMVNSRSFQGAHYSYGAYNTTRYMTGAYSKYNQRQVEALLIYNKQINDHSFDVTLGSSYWDKIDANATAAGRGASSDYIPTLNAAATPVSVTGTESERVLIGYFGRLNYDYKNRYLLTVNARADGASNLGSNSRWGFFPGLSAGWNIHEENFWSVPAEYVASAKFRLSYGVTGNISGLGDYQSQGSYSVGGVYNGKGAISNTGLANEDLAWERSKTIDFGLDLGVINNRIRIITDYFNRETSNLLTSYQLPHSTGFSSIITNLGSLQNRGYEIELQADILNPKSKVKWFFAFNAASVKNKILKLPDNGVENNRIGGIYIWDPKINDYSWQGGLQEGHTLGDMFGFKQLYIFTTDEEAKNATLDNLIPHADKTKYGGDAEWADLDGNGVIDAHDRLKLGNQYPKWTGGVSNTISYKGIELSIRADFALGHTIYNWAKALMLSGYSTINGLPTDIYESWQNPGDIAKYPRLYWGGQSAQRNIARLGDTRLDGGNSIFYESGNYLALREVTLAYNLPTVITKKIRLSGVRIYVTGNNMHYFTKYSGLNPEVGGREDGGNPLSRNITLGANINF